MSVNEIMMEERPSGRMRECERGATSLFPRLSSLVRGLGATALCFALGACEPRSPSTATIRRAVVDPVLLNDGHEVVQIQKFEKINGIRESESTYVAECRYNMVFQKSSSEIATQFKTEAKQRAEWIQAEAQKDGQLAMAAILARGQSEIADVMLPVALELYFGKFDRGHTVEIEKRFVLERTDNGWRLQKSSDEGALFGLERFPAMRLISSHLLPQEVPLQSGRLGAVGSRESSIEDEGENAEPKLPKEPHDASGGDVDEAVAGLLNEADRMESALSGKEPGSAVHPSAARAGKETRPAREEAEKATKAEPEKTQKARPAEPPRAAVVDEEPLRVGDDVKEPLEISRVQPVYPEAARKARLQGIVILEAVVGKEGNVEWVRVLRGINPLLDNAAMRAVQQWKYEPATQNGIPVAVYLTVTTTFKLQ